MKNFQQIFSLSRLNEIFENIKKTRIGIMGDMALDAYWYADLTKSLLSRETPRFPRPVIREEYAPGAGANVAQNLSAIGVGDVIAYTILGEDWRGNLLSAELQKRGIRTDRILYSNERTTSTYIKPILMGYESQQEDSRIDFENKNPLNPDLEERLISILQQDLAKVDAVYVADQFELNGIITDRVREAINQMAEENPGKIFMVDSRKRIGEFTNMILKPNWVEATRATFPDKDPREWDLQGLTEIGKLLSERTSRSVFITISDQGVLICDKSEQAIQIPSAPVTPPLDPVGAGDAFGSAVLATLASGGKTDEAGAMGCLAAGITVEKLNQTGTASPSEIRHKYNEVLEKYIS